MPKQSELITVEAHAFDIEIEENESPDGDVRSEIRMWCLNRKSEPCLLRVRDFPVFCKVELPRLKDSDGDPVSWDEQRCAEIIDDINRKLDNRELPPIRDWEYKKMKKLYYYTPDKRKFPFLIMSFNTVNHMYATSKACKKLYTRRYGPLTLPFYEMKIPIYNKMFSLQEMSMTDKFTCKAKEIDPDDPERISKEGPPASEYLGTNTIRGGRPFKEYEVKWTTMKPSKDVWFSYPIICSFDIESYSHNHRTFPQKHDDEDVIFSISVTISKYMDIGNRKDYIIIIGDTLPASKVDCPSAREGKLIIINVQNEEQVLQRFFEIIEYEDPDVFIGYNIYGFDFDYMDARILDSGDEWPNLSRLSDDVGGKFEIKNLTWSSSGRGANKMFLPMGSGRISFDMYKYIQMDFKFSTYSLDAMAWEFLKERKDDLKYHEMFEIYGRVKECMKRGEPFSQQLLEENTSVVKYNVQDSLLVTKLFEKLSVWVSVIELSSIVRVLPMQFCTRGQLMRCMAQIYHAASWKDIVLSTIDVKYNFFTGGYVANPLVGYWPLEMCFDFNSLYPSIIIAYNLCYTTWVRDIDKHIEKYGEDTIHIFDFEQEEPLGWKPPKNDKFDYSGYVKDSDAEEEETADTEDDDGKKKRKKKEVKKVKKHYRLAFCKKEFKKGFIPEIEEGLLENRKKVKKELKGQKAIVKNLNKYLFSAVRQNENMCLSNIEDQDVLKFLTEVGLTKNSGESQKLKDWMDKIQWRFDAFNMMMVGFLDARQRGLKICANSLYGYFGATTNELYFVQMSNIITYMGRSLIIEAGYFFKHNYNAIVVYGDTDSTMVNVPNMDEELLKVKKYIVNSDMDTDYAKEIFKRLENGETVEDPEMVWLLAEVMDHHINGKRHIYDEKGNIIEKGPPSIFLHPLYLEAEKMMKSIHFKKKHYVYFEYDKKGKIICVDGTNEPQLECKGILLARRDNCMWSRFIYKDIVLSVFDGATPADIFKKIVDVILEVVDAKYQTIVEKFSVVKGMGSNYKSKTTSMFVFGEEMKALKRPIQPGERVCYVVVKDHLGRKRVAERMRTVDLFHECWEASGLEYGDPVPEDFKPEEGMYPPEELDSIYYIENVLMNPIDRLFGCVFNRIIEPYTKVGYRPQKNRRLAKVYANTPVKMIVKAIKDNKKVIEKKGFRSMAEPIKSFVGWYEKIQPGHDYGRMDDDEQYEDEPREE